jgi:hypothetical protein
LDDMACGRSCSLRVLLWEVGGAWRVRQRLFQRSNLDRVFAGNSHPFDNRKTVLPDLQITSRFSIHRSPMLTATTQTPRSRYLNRRCDYDMLKYAQKQTPHLQTSSLLGLDNIVNHSPTTLTPISKSSEPLVFIPLRLTIPITTGPNTGNHDEWRTR